MDEETVRRIAREEIASLAGLVLRRTQEVPPGAGYTTGQAADLVASIFGEALRDFSQTRDEPGPSERG